MYASELTINFSRDEMVGLCDIYFDEQKTADHRQLSDELLGNSAHSSSIFNQVSKKVHMPRILNEERDLYCLKQYVGLGIHELLKVEFFIFIALHSHLCIGFKLSIFNNA